MVDAGVDAVVELDDGAVWPEPGIELLTGNQLARSLQQHGEYFHGLGRKSQFTAVLAQLARHWIQFVMSKSDQTHTLRSLSQCPAVSHRITLAPRRESWKCWRPSAD